MANRIVPTVLRVMAALLVLTGGALHLQLWLDQYRDVPSDVPGAFVVNPGFLVSAVVSLVLALAILTLRRPLVLALAILTLRRPLVWLLALLFELASIATLVLSRQASVFGWEEPDWSADAKRILVVEILAVVALAVLLAVDYARSGAVGPSAGPRQPPERRRQVASAHVPTHT